MPSSGIMPYVVVGLIVTAALTVFAVCALGRKGFARALGPGILLGVVLLVVAAALVKLIL